MGLKEKLASKSTGIAAAVDGRSRSDAAPRPPVTMPGQLGAFRLEAERYQHTIDELELQLLHAGSGREIPLTDLYEVEGRKRVLDAEAFEELRANLSQHPLTTPISVRRRPGGGFEVIAGHNRLEAFRRLGRETISAVILDVDDATAELSAFYSNLLAPALPDYERYLGFRKRQLATGFTESRLAEEAGIHQSQVSRLLKFGELPAAALTLIARRPSCLGVMAVGKLVDLCKEGRTSSVLDALEKLVADPAMTQIQAVTLAAEQPARAPLASKIVFRSGKKQFCEVRRRDKAVSIQFKTDEAAHDAWPKIEAILKELSGK